MTWGFISELPITPEQYDQLSAEIGADPPGLIIHTSSRTDAGMRIIDIWESEADYRRFEDEQLMPAVGRLGWPAPAGPPPTEEFEVHNMRGSGAWTALLPASRRRVERGRVARLATVGPDARPHLVPICFVLEGSVLYSAVDRKPKRSQALRRLENVRANPKVSVLVDRYDDDWTQLWWVRLDGEARVLTEGAEREHALHLLERKYPQYASSTPNGPVLAIEIEQWRDWEHGHSRP